jgi:hypothetical protein
MMTTTTETKRQFFMKLMTTQALKPYLKEAKRVGYTCNGSVQQGMFKVLTDECANHPAGEVVFRGVKHPGNGAWVVSFSTDYWVEPTMQECLDQSEWYQSMQGTSK